MERRMINELGIGKLRKMREYEGPCIQKLAKSVKKKTSKAHGELRVAVMFKSASLMSSACG